MVVGALLAGAVLFTSCRAEVNLMLDVEEDRSGTFAFELGLDEEFRELMESNDANPDDLFGELDPNLEGTTYEREEGAMSFQGVSVEFDDVDEFTAELADSTAEIGSFNSFSFVMDDTTAVFDASISAPEEDLGGDLPIDPSQLTDQFFSANFILSMPGTVTTHNADEVLGDGRLRWDLPLLGGESAFHAESDVGGGGFPWLWIILGTLLIAGLIAVGIAVTNRSKQQRQAVADAAAAHPAPSALSQWTPDTTAAAVTPMTAEEPTEPDAED
jgi:hypothetical protein